MSFLKKVQQKGRERMDICAICPEFKSSTGQCRKCGCFMKAKVLFPVAACPIGKW